MGLGTEFWAAMLGAVVGGLISAALLFCQFRREDRLRDAERLEVKQTISRSLLFKAIRFVSNLTRFNEHLHDNPKGLDESEPWTYVLPIINLPSKIEISPEEMSILLNGDGDELFNKVFNIESIHNTYLQSLQEYSAIRAQLGEKMPNHRFNGDVADSSLNQEEIMKLRPVMIQLNHIIFALKSRVTEDLSNYSEILEQITSILNRKHKLGVAIQPTKKNA